jgi:hypothetical protein
MRIAAGGIRDSRVTALEAGNLEKATAHNAVKAGIEAINRLAVPAGTLVCP